MKKIILDTNILLLPGQRMIDVFSQIQELMSDSYQLVVLSKTLDELKKLSAGKSKDARAAQLGLALVNAKLAEAPTLFEKIIGLRAKNTISLVLVDEYADDAIVMLANKHAKETIVATQDANLMRRLKKRDIPVIMLKAKQRLDFV